MRAARGTRFFSADLDIESLRDLQPLADFLEAAAFALRSTRERAAFQLSLELVPEAEDAESSIVRFVGLVDSLTPELRGVWDDARERTFNIGMQAGREPHSFEVALTPATLAAATRVGAGVTFTIYGAGSDASGESDA